MRAALVLVIERLEDAIYVIVAGLLVIASAFLLWNAGSTAIDELRTSQDGLVIVLTILDKGLVLFMVAELLHTVRITLRQRSLAAEPFLIVGLIAGIRRVLILTAQSEHDFHWNPQGIELAILVGLILVMAGAIFIWRRSGMDAEPGIVVSR